VVSVPRRAGARLGVLLGALLLLGFPFLGAGAFTTTLLTEALILGIWAMSLDLLVGYTGLVTFGHAAGFGLAAYAAGYFAQHVSTDVLAAMVVAQAVVLAVAVPIGFVVSRLSGVAFAIITLAISQVLLQIGVAWVPVTGGMDGLIGVPLPTLLGQTVYPGPGFYLLTAAALIVTYVALARLVSSPFGRALQAIRASEQRAAAIGINVRLHKWAAFVMSWSVAAIGGTLLVFMKAGTTPRIFHWYESGNVLAMTILGGLGTLFGPAFGAVVFVFLRDHVTTLFKAWQFSFGLVFVLAVIFLPRGLAGSASSLARHLWRPRF
jgi:branched-chain amino acid transport system permease protein